MMTNLGWSEEKSRKVEENYQKLYSVSMEYKKDRISDCVGEGYATVAFGLRVRTPMLSRVLLDTSVTPREAEAEGRTVGNAMGQSYGLLNNRAANEVMEKVLNSPYTTDILLCALIHDAMYFRVKDNLDALKFLNDVVGNAMSWCELPEIKHDQVGLSGELDIFYPDWSQACNLKNNISQSEIVKTIKDEVSKRKAKD